LAELSVILGVISIVLFAAVIVMGGQVSAVLDASSGTV
jgi:Flp pilus assembly pilin Flp